MKKKIISLIICVCIFSLPIQAQEEWTLRQCIEYAVENNLSVQRIELSVEQSEIEANTSKWTRLPNFNASSSQNFSWGRAASPIDNTYTNTNSANTGFNLSTNVPLFSGMQLVNQYELAKLNLKAAVEDLNKAKEDISINVASLYIQVLYNFELNNIAKEQLKLSIEQLESISKFSELGRVAPSKVAEAKARVAQDEVSVVQTENNYKLALLDLSQLLELKTPENFSIAKPNQEPNFAAITPPDEIYDYAASTRSGIIAAQYRLEGSEKSIKIAQGSYYPQVSLGAGMGTSYYTSSGRTTDPFFTQLDHNLGRSLGFNFSIPIFNRFSTRNRIQSAKLQQTNLSIQLEEIKKNLYKEIQQAWYSALAAEAKYNASVVAVSTNEEVFRFVNAKFNEDRATAIEFNEAKLNLTKSLSDKIQAKYDYIFRTKVLDFYKGIPIE